MIGSKTDDNEWRMDNRKINNGGTDKIDNSRKGQRAVKKRTKEILDLLEQGVQRHNKPANHIEESCFIKQSYE